MLLASFTILMLNQPKFLSEELAYEHKQMETMAAYIPSVHY